MYHAPLFSTMFAVTARSTQVALVADAAVEHDVELGVAERGGPSCSSPTRARVWAPMLVSASLMVLIRRTSMRTEA